LKHRVEGIFRLAALLLACTAFAGTAPAQQAPAEPATPAATVAVVMHTALGDIHVALAAQRAPITVANFLRYVDARQFDNTTFYRAVKVGLDDLYGLVQGGVKGGDPRKLFPPIAHESPAVTGLSHVDGTISMAREDPGTATADFFFIIGDLTTLDGKADGTDPGYAAFGRVTQGMDILKQILKLPRSESAGEGVMKGQMLAEPVQILSIRRLDR
jgi:peptidyl-prolyl cis-trans isomerase A (cyclophilin A)